MLNSTDNATRIDAACFVDGDDDEFVVEFWDLGGSILRTCYNRRTTRTDESFIPVDSWEFTALQRMAQATFYDI